MADNHRLEAEDWICMSCNNLNYSFRKVCNRCKVTTREDNLNYSQLQYYSIYYHSSFYAFQENQKSNCQSPSQEFLTLPNHINQPHSEHQLIGRTKPKAEGLTIKKWNLNDEEVMALVPNAWEGLKMDEQQICGSSQSSAQHLGEDWDDQEATLPNFDLTFL